MLPAETARDAAGGSQMVVIARKGAGELKWTAIDAELLASVANLRRKLGGNLRFQLATESGRD